MVAVASRLLYSTVGNSRSDGWRGEGQLFGLLLNAAAVVEEDGEEAEAVAMGDSCGCCCE